MEPVTLNVMARRRFVFAVLVLTLALPLAATAQEVTEKSERAVLQKVQPVYPDLARKNGLVGAVKLKVVIAPDGRTTEVDVVGGNPVFVEAATSSVKKWKWSAADHPTTQVVEIRFQSGM